MIVDAFTFYNEVDLLEFRLRYLYEHVDTFVVCEATHTHKGRPKPLYFSDNAERFAPYRDKISYVLVDDLPLDSTDHWDRENHQRNALSRGLPSNLGYDDWIVISDVDEIPHQKSLKALETTDAHLVGFRYQLAMFKINRIATQAEAHSIWSVAARGTITTTPQKLRDSRHLLERNELSDAHFKSTTLENAGWHWTYLGDQAFVYEKLNTMLHLELDPKAIKKSLNFETALQSPRDPLGRPDFAWELVDIDHSFPHLVHEEPQSFDDWIHKPS